MAEREAFHVRSLKKDLSVEVAAQNKSEIRRAELYYMPHKPTFRAALIGDAVLGLEPYIPSPIHEAGLGNTPDDAQAPKSLFPSGLKLIITKYIGRIRSQLPHCAAYGPRPASRPGEARTSQNPSHLLASPGTVSSMFPLREPESSARPPRQFPR